MIKMTYGQLSTLEFMRACQKLGGMPFQGAIAFAIKKVMEDVTKQRKIIADEWERDIVNQFALKDETGKIIKPENSTDDFTVPDEKKPDFEKAKEEFGKKEFVIHREALKEEYLHNVMVTPSECNYLVPLFTEVAEHKDNVLPMSG